MLHKPKRFGYTQCMFSEAFLSAKSRDDDELIAIITTIPQIFYDRWFAAKFNYSYQNDLNP